MSRIAIRLVSTVLGGWALLAGAHERGIDFWIVRENTEGMYAGRERREGDTAIAERVITAKGSERIARVAFEGARMRNAECGMITL